MARWSIPPQGVIGHSDMAPGRKGDPGARFDWRRLALQGLSVWPEAAAPGDFRADLRRFGYPDLPDDLLLQAFRLRFRPWAVGPQDGRMPRWPPIWPRALPLTGRGRGVSRIPRGWPDDRGVQCRKVASEESPGSMKQGCRVTPGGGNPRESATEKRQPSPCARVMVKRWGKSPPRTGQPGRHGKPHPEQCRIGASRGTASARIPPQGCFSPRGPGWQLDPSATAGREEWSSSPGSRSGGDRTRLTGHPRASSVDPGASPRTPGIFGDRK